MKQNDFEISIRFQGNPYSFAFGSQAYIFHTGILNGFFGSVKYYLLFCI